MKKRKIRYKTGKFFGYSDEGWARSGGRWGKKRSYGHFSPGNPGGRTRAEIQNADDLRQRDERSFD